MKASFYNYELPYSEEENKMILYNSRTNALALINAEQYHAYVDFCQNGKGISDSQLLSDLELGGFVIDDQVDELDIIRLSLLKSRFNTSRLALTIAPTSDCNFRCIYCYEKESLRTSFMSKEVQHRVIELIKQMANTISVLRITWYGGEPLLALDSIEYMSKAVLEICKEYKISYSAGIITNGYLLTPEVAKKLGEMKVTSIQITIDGMQEEHDKRRPLKGGLPTYKKIINNLVAAQNDLPCKVAIRINADKSNINQVDHVVKDLKDHGLDNVTSTYLALVENTNATYSSNKCFCAEEFAVEEYDFHVRNSKQGVRSYPHLVNNVCIADSRCGMVIDSDGSIYKCWSEIGIKNRAIGNLLEKTNYNFTVIHEYLLYDPTRDPECINCKCLPICMGGCPHRRVFAPEIRCTFFKYYMTRYLSDAAKLLKSKKGAERTCL